MLEVVSVLLTTEAGTVLVDAFEFAVAYDLGIGVVDLQRAEQGDEGGTLGWGTGVGSTATVVETTLVADADGVGVVMAGMGADHLLGTAEMELAVTGDVVVVAAAVPAFGTVHLVEHLEGEVLVRAGGRAVNHNQINSTHNSFF